MSFFSVRVFPPIKACATSVKVHLSHTTRPLPLVLYHFTTSYPCEHFHTYHYLVDMHRHVKPSMQGAQRQRPSSPSYAERQSLPPFRDSVPNNYVPSVRKTFAAAPSAQSQPPMYHPSQYDRAPQTNHALGRTEASVPATMSPVDAAKHLVSSGDTLPSAVMLSLTKYLLLSRQHRSWCVSFLLL